MFMTPEISKTKFAPVEHRKQNSISGLGYKQSDYMLHSDNEVINTYRKPLVRGLSQTQSQRVFDISMPQPVGERIFEVPIALVD